MVVFQLPLVSPEPGVEVAVLEVAALEVVLEAEVMGLVEAAAMGLVEVVVEPKLGMEVPSEDKVSARSLLNVY